MSKLSAALDGIRLGREDNARQEQAKRQAKRQDQLFKFASDKNKREQKVFDRQEQFVDIVASGIRGVDTVGAPEILAGGPQGVGEDGLPVLRKADGVPTPTVAPVSADTGKENFQKLLGDPAFLFAAKQAGIDLTEISRLMVQRESLEERRFAGEERRDISREGQLITRRGQTLEQERFEKEFTKTTEVKGGETFEVFRRLQARGGGVSPVAPGGTLRFKTKERKALPSEAAGKLGLLVTGIQDIRDFKAMVIKSNGKVDRRLLAEMKTNFPFSRGREAFSLAFNAIEAKLRIESGAAVPEEEVVRMARRFVPSVLDNDSTVKSKIRRMDLFLAGTAEAIDPNKTYTNKFIDTQGNQFGIPTVTKDTPLDEATVEKILALAGGDREKARSIAREMGYKF